MGDRVIPVVEGLRECDAKTSIDTCNPDVAAAALDEGASVITDVTGIGDTRVCRLVAERDVLDVIVPGPAPVDREHEYEASEVVESVFDDLTERLLLAERAGIARSDLIVDPGLGVGKTTEVEHELVDRLDVSHALGTPVMAGHRRRLSPKDGSDRGDPDPNTKSKNCDLMWTPRSAPIPRWHSTTNDRP